MGDSMKLLCALALTLASGSAAAHSGGTDAQGCHTNRKTGEYHCHGSKGTSAAAAPRQVAPAQSDGQSCYVGPRGGTYTITKSGKKNYAGC
ncbi:YHYH domain-containing protein [Polaromonas sp.]|uniref:YHYH domain-containing protein n=1 Tax=Polaromonas sp. TaxID=1869339 RepID=UPI003456B9AE